MPESRLMTVTRKFWVIGGAVLAAIGIFLIVMFFVESMRQPITGAAGAIFLVVALLAIRLGLTRPKR